MQVTPNRPIYARSENIPQNRDNSYYSKNTNQYKHLVWEEWVAKLSEIDSDVEAAHGTRAERADLRRQPGHTATRLVGWCARPGVEKPKGKTVGGGRVPSISFA